MPKRSALCAGELVQVRSKEEILLTLDERGRLDELPFMPEMLAFCGRTFRVGKRAHKTCDPVNGLESRRLTSAVHLEDLRCTGADHAGCQAGCLLFWKEAWLKRLAAEGPSMTVAAVPRTGPGTGCTERQLFQGALAPGENPSGEDVTFVCQATQVAAATTRLRWWDLRQYVEDYTSGNATIRQMFSALLFSVYHNVSLLGIGLGATMRWSYDRFQQLIDGSPYPWRLGRVKSGTRTPTAELNVQVGELVRIKTYQEILNTLDEESKNRGLYFDGEMVPYTGRTHQVLKRVDRIIDEKTGKMLRFKTASLILDNVVCQARYAKCRKLCPRAYYLYWREIWLERIRPTSGRHSESEAATMSETAR